MNNELEQLCGIMTKLRAEGGCGWDRKQTLSSLKRYLIEEAYETIDAIDEVERNPCKLSINEHCEELGDLLFQIVFQSEIQREKNAFDMADVCRAISAKLIRRHPHIFGSEDNTAGDDNPHWEKIKETERAEKGAIRESALDGIPKSAPPLTRASMLGAKASTVGFDWPDYRGSLAKLHEEVLELDEVVHGSDRSKIEHELGDIMLSCIDLARHLGFDAETTINKANKRFETRFRHMENIVKIEDKSLNSLSQSQLEEYWQQAKLQTN